MSVFKSEEERQTAIQRTIAEFEADINDKTLPLRERQESAEALKNYKENIQVEDLYIAAKQSPDPDISAGRDPLVKMFMRESAETLHSQQKPQTIGTPKDFFEWLFTKPRFK